MERISRICQSLSIEINEKTYQPSTYTRFAVIDPKIREIYAPAFRDRLVQSWLVYHLSPAVERVLIDDTFANRKRKGTLFAVQRVQTFMRKPLNSHYLQLDIQNFFNSIELTKLMALCETILNRYFNQHPLKMQLDYVLKQCIFHDVATNTVTLSGDSTLLSSIPEHKTLQAAPKGHGLPLGSVASQMFANIYLNPLDQYIKHHLNVKGYVRYMDDLILTGPSIQQLLQWKSDIALFVKDLLNLNLHPKKQTLQRCDQGADYLGYKVYPHYLHLRKRNIRKLISWLHYFNTKLAGKTGKATQHIEYKQEWEYRFKLTSPSLTPSYELLQQMQAIINSYYGLMKHANHYRLRKLIYHKHFHVLKKYYLPSDPQYHSVHIKKHYLNAWVVQNIK